MQVDTSRRNVLLTPQFVTGAATADSEELSVGGTDNGDGSVFDPCDYVALGHIHRPQNMGSPRLQRCIRDRDGEWYIEDFTELSNMGDHI